MAQLDGQTGSDADDGLGSVAVIITTYNDAEFLPDAIESVLAQTKAAAEIIVVDDGSSTRPDVSSWRSVRLIQKQNGGLSSARNAGLREAKSEFVLFLDADDRLRPRAIECNLKALRAEPHAAMAYGAYINVDAQLRPIGAEMYVPAAPKPLRDFYKYNTIGMHAAVLYRRAQLMDLHGFDESLRLCEDYDLYFRLAQKHGVVSHPEVVAEYRRHGSNISNDVDKMLRAALAVHARYRPEDSRERVMWKEGRRMWRRIYLEPFVRKSLRRGSARASKPRGVAAALELAFHDPSSLRRLVTFGKLWRAMSKPSSMHARAQIDFGSFSGTTPISMDFGFDRGLPVDRHYIEAFLAQHAKHIRGRVLEIGDAAYSERFGGTAITRQDVLHAKHGVPGVTIVGDLQQADLLPPQAFDCIILTQTLHLLYDFRSAIAHVAAALKPGGVILATVPGISQIDRGEWRDTWYWSFTPASVRRLFDERFTPAHVSICKSGNVYAATAFLQGLAVSDVDAEKLEIYDSAYPVIIGVCAQRASDALA